MSDLAAKREARRRRILQNSESRLQSITQSSSNRFKEKSIEEFNSNNVCTKSISEDFISSSSFTTNKEIKCTNIPKNIIEDEMFNFQEFEFSKSDMQYKDSDHFKFNFSDQQHLFKDNEETCNNLNFDPKFTSSSHVTYNQYKHSRLSHLFFGSVSSVILAAFVNILLIIHTDVSLYKSIITPYLIMEVTRLCLGNKSEESQGNKMLVATLILCNVQPEIVHMLKRSLALCSMILKNFALYLTSFVLFNWIASVSGINSSHLQFS